MAPLSGEYVGTQGTAPEGVSEDTLVIIISLEHMLGKFSKNANPNGIEVMALNACGQGTDRRRKARCSLCQCNMARTGDNGCRGTAKNTLL